MKLKLSLLLIIVLMLSLVPTFAQVEDPDEATLRQWASSADATSEYTATNWNAMQATGEPDTGVCADAPTAWASLSNNSVETLNVYYDVAVTPTQVNIYQTFNPGAITGIALIPADGSEPLPVRGSADPGTPCPGVLTIDLNLANIPYIYGIQINLDQSLTGDWNEIDAVEMVGIVPDGPPVPLPNNNGSSNNNTDTNTNNNSTFTGPAGMTVECNNGTTITNGIPVTVVQMRSGFTYTATALGINGFDPVLAVLDENGRGLCTDDDVNAATFTAQLPTTGLIEPNNTNSQVPFANNSRFAFEDVTIVVGGFGDQTGEFLLLLEGMALTSADGAGDPFSVEITPGMVASGVPVSAYMISVTSRFDPLIALVDSQYEFVQDSDGVFIACDDSGNPELCWGDSSSMSRTYVSRAGRSDLGGYQFDSMLTLPLEEGMEGGFFNFLMRSSGMNTFGDYVVAFHMGIGQP